MASLADIRRRFAEQENKRNSSKSEGEGPIYPHWNIKEGETAVLRFLPDGNAANPYFWVERLMFKFPFNGIKGDPSSGKVIVQVPCMEMYGDKDAVLDEVRTWFKDESMKEMGRAYWKKKTYLFQGFVRSDPMGGQTPENPIRRFMISPQIFNKIKGGLTNPEIEHLPTDYINGLDFHIKKEPKSGTDYADYNGSEYSRRETSLSEAEAEAIDKFGLSNLADFLPVKPTPEVQAVIFEMFEASVNGEAYDPARWGSYFTPPGMQTTGNAIPTVSSTDDSSDDDVATTVAAKVAKTTTVTEKQVAQAEVAPAPAPATTVTSTPADDAKSEKTKNILAMIKQRQQQ